MDAITSTSYRNHNTSRRWLSIATINLCINTATSEIEVPTYLAYVLIMKAPAYDWDYKWNREMGLLCFIFILLLLSLSLSKRITNP